MTSVAGGSSARRLTADEWASLPEDAKFGIRYYWLLDPQRRTLQVLERDQSGEFVYALGAQNGVVREIPGCEGLAIDLDQLWIAVDALGSVAR